MKKWKLITRFSFAGRNQLTSPCRHISELTCFDRERCGLCPDRDHASVIWTHSTDYGWQSERLSWDAKKDFDT